MWKRLFLTVAALLSAGWFPQKAFAAKNAISIGITCVVGSIIGLFLIPVMFGGLYAFGVHLQTNQELLVIQKELLALSKRAE